MNLGAATRTITVANASTISGVISGSGVGLVKAGSATLTLSGTNTYSGGTSINGGTLSISADRNLGAVPSSSATNLTFDGGTGGTLQVTSSVTLDAKRDVLISAPATINTSNSLTVLGAVSGTSSLTKTGSGTVTLSNTSNPYTGALTVSAGTLTASNAIAFSGITVAGSGTLNLNAGINASSLAVTNQGALNLTGTTGVNSIQGSATTSTHYTGTTSVAGSGVLTANCIRQDTLSIGNGATVTLTESSPNLASGWPSGNDGVVNIVKNVSLTGTAKLDLTNNDLIVDYSGGSSPAAALEAMVRTGYNGGAWNGSGFISYDASARNIFTLLVFDNAAGSLTTFDGVSVGTSTVIVKFTHQSDLNCDGVDTSADLTIFSSNYAAYNVDNGNVNAGGPVTHAMGDMDFNGLMTFNDAMLFTNFYNESLAHLPEPASLAFLALGTVGLLGRKRR